MEHAFDSRQAAPWYTHRWPWLLMLGPLLVLVAAFYTTWLAMQSPDALVAGDYYKKGKAINQDLRREKAAQSLGLSAALGFDAGAGRLRGSVKGRSAVDGVVTLRFVHATQPGKDMLLSVRPGRDGRFEAALPALARTRWLVTLEQGRDWRFGGEWTWPAQREVAFAAGS